MNLLIPPQTKYWLVSQSNSFHTSAHPLAPASGKSSVSCALLPAFLASNLPHNVVAGGEVRNSLADRKEVVKGIPVDRRSAKRLRLNFPIEVTGLDRTGHFFTERAKTVDISECGCRFDLFTPVERGNVVAIKLLPPAKTALLLFEIIWTVPRTSGWTVGTLKLQDDKIWKVTFPSANPSSDQSSKQPAKNPPASRCL